MTGSQLAEPHHGNFACAVQLCAQHVPNRVPEVGFEPTPPCEERILSPSCLPFHHSGECCDHVSESCVLPCCHSLRSRGVLQFFVGLIVGASVVALLMIVIAPSRRVRAERPLPRDVETRLLL